MQINPVLGDIWRRAATHLSEIPARPFELRCITPTQRFSLFSFATPFERTYLMRAIRVWVSLSGVAIGVLLSLSASAAFAEDISGPISTTRTIRENSRLVGDVTCTVTGAPCIQFATSHIELRLNGFTMTGPADPATACGGSTSTAAETGINSGGQPDVESRGAGIVQRFRGDGILFNGTLQGKVEGVTTTTNCMSGIRVAATSSRITLGSNVSVRNGSAVPGLSCGGI